MTVKRFIPKLGRVVKIFKDDSWEGIISKITNEEIVISWIKSDKKHPYSVHYVKGYVFQELWDGRIPLEFAYDNFYTLDNEDEEYNALFI